MLCKDLHLFRIHTAKVNAGAQCQTVRVRILIQLRVASGGVDAPPFPSQKSTFRRMMVEPEVALRWLWSSNSAR